MEFSGVTLAILVTLISIVIILSIVHISGKVDEMCKKLDKTNEMLEKIANTKE